MMGHTVGSLLIFAVVLMYTEATGKCHRELERIDDMIAEKGRLVGTIRPRCLPDGSYAAKQCLGSVCRCVGSEGNVLTRNDINIGLAYDMDCKCLRDQDEYRKLGIIGKMHFCEENGNYSPVQCTGSVCHCADRDGKRIGDSAVHITMMDTLNCQ